MLASTLLPGFAQWGARLDALLARPEPLWVWGAPGTGVTSLAAQWAARRGADWCEAADCGPIQAWVRAHPGGVIAAREGAPAGFTGLEVRLPALEDDPRAIPALLEALATEEGVPLPVPSALGTLPCPGNLRELRLRVVRWKLLGQLPDPTEAGPLRLEAEDLATNLHELERFLLHRALRRAYGNRVEAALRLGVSRRQLYLLIARHGDPVRGEAPSGEVPVRLRKRRGAQNSSPEPPSR